MSLYNDLSSLLTQVITWLNGLVVLYAANGILSVFLAIFIVRKIAKLLYKVL